MFEKVFISILILSVTACHSVDDVRNLQSTVDEAQKITLRTISVCSDKTIVDGLKRDSESLNRLSFEGDLKNFTDWTTPDRASLKGAKAWKQRRADWHQTAKMTLDSQTKLGAGKEDVICRTAISEADEYLKQFD